MLPGTACSFPLGFCVFDEYTPKLQTL
uniref:Uncharacterized protein n=1 Tax=Rhizophora mucronata TaxID=61149 RepID=A0A2P2MER5_RHIMU